MAKAPAPTLVRQATTGLKAVGRLILYGTIVIFALIGVFAMFGGSLPNSSGLFRTVPPPVANCVIIDGTYYRDGVRVDHCS